MRGKEKRKIGSGCYLIKLKGHQTIKSLSLLQVGNKKLQSIKRT